MLGLSTARGFAMTTGAVSDFRYKRLVMLERQGDRAFVACDCGARKTVSYRNLVNGRTTSCGCYRSEHARNLHTTHGESKTRLYRIWHLMRDRCQSPNNPNYKDYGKRGITVSEEWKSYETFRDWALANGYQSDLTIERINNDLGYSATNCAWVTRKAQTQNRRVTVRLPYKGQVLPLYEVAKLTGRKPDFFYWRLRSGKTPEEAMQGID